MTEEIQAEYDVIAKRFGDLNFVRESLVGQLQALDEELKSLRQARSDLQKRLQETQNAVVPPSGS